MVEVTALEFISAIIIMVRLWAGLWVVMLEAAHFIGGGRAEELATTAVAVVICTLRGCMVLRVVVAPRGPGMLQHTLWERLEDPRAAQAQVGR